MAKVPDDNVRSTVRFMLDGKRVELSDVDPTRTVLQFLREDLRRTGTKEGCAEGDCGACTVVVAELDRSGDDITVRAINSCIQFVPTLDGKELITVESLTVGDQELHPVQQAMVEHHGSQCGFCTPGFIMSMFALYKTSTAPTRVQVDDALAGNLCRCTGYRPIIAAAQSMYDAPAGDDWLRQPYGSGRTSAERINRLRAIADDRSLAIDNGTRRFYAPVTADELARLLNEYPDATILAGGTDVGLWVTKQHRELDTIVYTGRVRELLDITKTDSHIEIGAAATLSDVVPVIVELYPSLQETFLRFASPPIRNAATLGGNVANGSPIGDSMPALMALNTTLVLRSAKGAREVSLDDFYKDYMVNDLRPGEFVQAMRVPQPQPGVDVRSYKVSKRFDQDISAVCGAFCLRLDGKRVAGVRISFGGMAATIKRALHCEQSLLGGEWSEDSVQRAMQALADDFEPIGDMRSTADYRLRVSQNLLRRLYMETTGGLTDTVYRYGRTG
jgi:xanthine dehydrogenase small subunit